MPTPTTQLEKTILYEAGGLLGKLRLLTAGDDGKPINAALISCCLDKLSAYTQLANNDDGGLTADGIEALKRIEKSRKTMVKRFGERIKPPSSRLLFMVPPARYWMPPVAQRT